MLPLRTMPSPRPGSVRVRTHGLLVTLALALAACGGDAGDADPGHDAAAAPPETPAAASQAFEAAGVTGAMLVRRLSDGHEWVHDAGRVDRRFLPASTFKIVNAAIALETGVVTGPDEVFAWDGVEREFAGWNADHTLASGMSASAVPVYQEVARRIGEPRMTEWLVRLGYGNASTGGGIDRFWLDGALAVSAREQVDFLERWILGELPLAPATLDQVEAMLVQNSEAGVVLRAKTGWAFEAELGWWVGWIERDGERWIFALNMDMPEVADAPRRIEVGTAALREVGALPSG
jgi:beta-lactamase class D